MECIGMNICVYGAASADIDKSFIETVEKLGRLIAEGGHGLVFGGGAAGMMGAAARGAYSANGKIIGVIPTFFNVDGVLFEHCDELIRTETMRERKQIMEDRADAFITTPGGIGTFEEFFEILTLKQLGRHTKPIVILNTNGYYDSMLAMLDMAIEKEFLLEASKKLFHVCDTPEQAMEYIKNYVPEGYNILEVRKIKDKR